MSTISSKLFEMLGFISLVTLPIPAFGQMSMLASAPPINGRAQAQVYSQCSNAGQWALTFDDGPSRNVPGLVERLNSLGIKATFFVNGRNIADLSNPTGPDAIILKNAFNSGHQIASHTFTHANLAQLSFDDMWREMQLNDNAIAAIIGKRPLIMRPPYLAINDDVLAAMGTWGYKVVTSNLDTRDFEAAASADILQFQHQNVDGVIAQSDPRFNSFISLNHDFTNKVTDWVSELSAIVKAKGYRFVTVAECIGQPAYQGENGSPMVLGGVWVPTPTVPGTMGQNYGDQGPNGAAMSFSAFATPTNFASNGQPTPFPGPSQFPGPSPTRLPNSASSISVMLPLAIALIEFSLN